MIILERRRGCAGMVWVELCHCVPHKECEVLFSSTCVYDLIWKQAFADDQVKMRSLGWAVLPYD